MLKVGSIRGIMRHVSFISTQAVQESLFMASIPTKAEDASGRIEAPQSLTRADGGSGPVRRSLADFFHEIENHGAEFLFYDNGYRSWKYTYVQIGRAAVRLQSDWEQLSSTRATKPSCGLRTDPNGLLHFGVVFSRA